MTEVTESTSPAFSQAKETATAPETPKALFSARYLTSSGQAIRESDLASIDELRPLIGPMLAPDQKELLVVLVRPESGGQLRKLRETVIEVAVPLGLKKEPMELSFRQERLLYQGSFAILIGEEASFNDSITGIASGIACAGELDALTSTVGKLWENCKTDKKLAGKVGKDEVAHWDRVSSLMNETFQSRMTYVELEERTELLAEELMGGAKKAFSAIVDEIEFEDRMEVLDEKIDVLQDIYELCNDRISEFNYFHKEWLLEVWILIVLVLEIVLMAMELLKGAA